MNLQKVIKKIFKFQNLPPLILLTIAAVISERNFIPGTWLTGWDNLHPEFNLLLNLERAFSAVWQEYQGVGLLGGMGHAADLPRIILLSIFSIVIPNMYLRYLWTFLMLTIGPLGTYFFISRVIGEKVNKLSIFLGALFYLLNLATVQYFYTPYESFVSFYGFLPWLLFASYRYLKSGKGKDLAIFSILSLVSTPAFYVQTLFIVYLIILGIMVLKNFISKDRNGILRFVKLIGVIICTNLFWLLPVIYFALTNGNSVSLSKINSIATPETVAFNEGAGNLKDLLLLKGFWFYYTDLGETGKFGNLMQIWIDWYGKISVNLAGYFLSFVGISGLLLSFFKKRTKLILLPIILFIFSLIILRSTNPPFGFLFKIFTSIPFFAEAFRSVFTKWSIPFLLSLCFGVAYFVDFIETRQVKFKNFIFYSVASIVAVAIFITCVPAFKGNLTMRPAKIQIPQEYFNLFNFFDNEPKEARIAFFPAHSFWGWNFYDWGYRGSGYLWYGIKQPILDRAFDVWSPKNETFYEELHTALDGDDINAFSRVVKKYDVSFLLLDEHVVLPDQDREMLKIAQTKKIAELLNLPLVFKDGHLSVYKFKEDKSQFVSSLKNYTQVGLNNRGSIRNDPAFEIYGDYITRTESNDNYFPNSYLLGEKVDGYKFDNTSKRLNLPLALAYKSSLELPAVKPGTEVIINSTVEFVGGDIRFQFEPLVQFNSLKDDFGKINDVSIKLPKTGDHLLVSMGQNIFEVERQEKTRVSLKMNVADSVNINIYDKAKIKEYDLSKEFNGGEFRTCWQREGGESLVETQKRIDSFYITTRDAAGCKSIKIGDLPTNDLLSVEIPYRSVNGSRPSFCILEEGNPQCINKEFFYNVPPSESFANFEQKTVIKNKNGIWIDVAARPSEEPGKTWSIEYKTPKVLSFSTIVTKEIPDFWNSFTDSKKIEVPSNQKFDVSTEEIKIDFFKQGLETPVNCDVFQRGKITKDNSTNKIKYTVSDRATACDNFSITDALTSNSYLIRFLGDNISGRSLKFYLYNKATNNADLETLLPSGLYDETYSILSWPLGPQDYVLNIESRSFGKESENILSAVYLYNLPLEWLSKWRTGDPMFLTSDINIKSSNKVGTYKYIVSASGSGVITLSQGYDKGWSAYVIESGNKKSVVKKLLPFLGKKLEHVKVNSWKNGWIVQPSDLESRTSDFSNQKQKNLNTASRQLTADDYTIVIVYWPQYLEYFGFLTLDLLLIYIIYKALSKKHPKLFS